MPGPLRVRFGVFEVDLTTRELRKQGLRLKLQDQPFQVLESLLERPGLLVTRDELRLRIWGSDTFVDFDQGLNRAVNKLRDALGDTAETPRFIETLPRRGYRFIAPVESPPEIDAKLPAGVTPKPLQLPHSRPAGLTLLYGALASGVLLALALLVVRRPQIRSADIALPLTSLPGAAGAPTLSPDGNQVAFAWNGPEGNNFDIYTMAIPGGAPIRLTDHPAVDQSPAWSPDGRWIAFLRAGDVFLIGPSGGPPRQVAHVAPAAGTICECESGKELTRFLGWTPDSQHLVVSDSSAGAPLSLWLLDIGTRQLRPLTNPPTTVLGDSDPVVASDSSWLAFRRAVSAITSELYVQPLAAGFIASGEPRKLNSACGTVTLASIPGESSLVFSSGPAMSDYLRLWRMRIPALSPVPLQAPGTEGGIFPSVAKSGRLVFQKNHTEIGEWRVDLSSPTRVDGPPRRAYALSPRRADHSAQISPTDNRIVFSSNRSGANEIWTSDLDGRSAVPLTDLRAFSGSPRWSPDGQTIAFDSNKDCAWHVYTIPAIGGKPRQLTFESSGQSSPAWSADGKSIYYTAGPAGRSDNLWSIPADGGPARPVTTDGGHRSVVSSDGQTLYYTAHARGTLWRTPIDDLQPTKLGDFRIANTEFTLGRDGIYFLDVSDAQPGASLKYLDFASGAVTLMVRINQRPAQGLSLSRDGRTLLWSQVERDSSDLMFADNVH